ncbi:MAG: GNAT family N-acetyltransferase [Saprospiraceae bacterium]
MLTTTDPNIRPVTPNDLPALKAVIDGTGLFPAELLDEMIAPFFAKSHAGDFWLTYQTEQPIAVAYFAPERLTSGTYNLYLIAVHPDYQSRGIGAALLQHIEQFLRERGERILLVETSGLPAFERTRAFYQQNAYVVEARIREFYAAGEDKIVFWKALTLPE